MLVISLLSMCVSFFAHWYSLSLISPATPQKQTVDSQIPPSPRTPSGKLRPKCKTCKNYMLGHDKAACDALKSRATSPSVHSPNTISPPSTISAPRSPSPPSEDGEEFNVCIFVLILIIIVLFWPKINRSYMDLPRCTRVIPDCFSRCCRIFPLLGEQMLLSLRT
jgi:hypothetical protein